MILDFAGGPKIVYKPKDLQNRGNLSGVHSVAEPKALVLSLRTTRVLVRDGYGYVEYIAHQGCETVDQFKNFYRRAGMQLCLLYALQATDFHNENVIACGDYPVLVDLEALFHPEVRIDVRSRSAQ